jgi:polyphenol oxidase
MSFGESVKDLGGLSILSFDLLESFGISHGMVVKTGGRDIEEYQAYRELGRKNGLVVTRQPHGELVELIGPGRRPFYPDKVEADGLMTGARGTRITIHTADCVPVFLADKGGSAVCLIHAGWRGTALGIVRKGLLKFMSEFRLKPEGIAAAIGPAIEQNCYQVGAEVADRFGPGSKTAEGGGKWRLDLKGENRLQLIQAGLAPQNIQVSGLCTLCRDDLLHSYRREKDLKGQMISFMEA